MVERLHRRGEADALAAAEQRRRRHPAVLEDHVGGMGAAEAHLLVGLGHGEAGRAGFDQEGRDAGDAGFLGRGAREHGEQAGMRRVGGEALGAVDDVVVAVAHGARGERGGVRSRVRLGEAEGGQHLALGDARQIVLALLFGAVDRDAERADAIGGAEIGAIDRRGIGQRRPRPAPLRRATGRARRISRRSSCRTGRAP